MDTCPYKECTANLPTEVCLCTAELYGNKITNMQATIDESVHIMDSLVKCWRGTEPNDSARAIVRAVADDFIDEHGSK